MAVLMPNSHSFKYYGTNVGNAFRNPIYWFL